MHVEIKALKRSELLVPEQMEFNTLYEVVQSPHPKHIGLVVFRAGSAMVSVNDTNTYWSCLHDLSQIKLIRLPAGAQVIWTQQ